MNATDISQLLGLQSRGARVILGVFILSNLLFVATTADLLTVVWPAYAAVALVTVGGVVVTRPHPEPFPLGWTLLTLGIVVMATALVCMALPDDGALGRSTWYLGANTWLLWFLILRRRLWWAWAGGLTMLVETIVWAHLAGRGALAGLLLASPQVLLLLIATLFGAALRRSTSRTAALAQRSVDAAAAAGAVEAARRIQDQRADELAQIVVPVLTVIAAGTGLDQARQEEIIRVEAQLRDSVRGRGLALPPIVEAATRARSRGVQVTLLDDLGVPLASSQVPDVVGAVIEALDAAPAGTVTARLLPPTRAELLTVVTQDAAGGRRVVVERAG